MKKWLALLLCATFLTGCGNVTNETAEPSQTIASEIETTVAETVVEQEDPAADGVLDVLLIGNSFCRLWPDELAAMLSAAGVEARIYSVYYSGCSIQNHWKWLQEDKSNYEFYRYYSSGVGSLDSPLNVSLSYCLRQQNWDVISLQHHFGGKPAWYYDNSLADCRPYAQKLFDYLKENFPKTKLVWHQTWTYEVGPHYEDIDFNREYQQQCHQNIRKVSQVLAEENNVALAVTGDAWEIARGEYGFHDMCQDAGHDGAYGGGQYLNACVWFETLTGSSCIGNTWRPGYALDEERILQLQQIAHRAEEENTFKLNP